MTKVHLGKKNFMAAAIFASIALGAGLAFFYVRDPDIFSIVKPASRLASSTNTSNKDVPELSAILNSQDQNGQLKATRALAERVGPEQTLEILKTSGLPFTGEGHFAVHQVGYVAYEKYGVDALLHCRDYFLYACYHGAMIEAANKEDGFPTIAAMADKCRGTQPRFVQCVHAAGHGILAIWNYEVPDALKTCDKLFEGEKQYEGSLTYCHSGVFMENIFGVHDWGHDKPSPNRKWLSDQDIYFPCDKFSEKYQEGCWQNQATRIYQMVGGDVAKTAKACNAADNKYKAVCFDNLARQIHPMTSGEVQKVYSMCAIVGDDWKDTCVTVNAGSYFSVGDGPTAIRVCNGASEGAREGCFATVVGYTVSGEFSLQEKKSLCNLMEQTYAQNCLKSLGG